MKLKWNWKKDQDDNWHWIWNWCLRRGCQWHCDCHCHTHRGSLSKFATYPLDLFDQKGIIVSQFTATVTVTVPVHSSSCHAEWVTPESHWIGDCSDWTCHLDWSRLLTWIWFSVFTSNSSVGRISSISGGLVTVYFATARSRYSYSTVRVTAQYATACETAYIVRVLQATTVQGTLSIV